jgi:hypothetical protein
VHKDDCTKLHYYTTRRSHSNNSRVATRQRGTQTQTRGFNPPARADVTDEQYKNMQKQATGTALNIHKHTTHINIQNKTPRAQKTLSNEEMFIKITTLTAAPPWHSKNTQIHLHKDTVDAYEKNCEMSD